MLRRTFGGTKVTAQVERCEKCGFNAGMWTDQATVTALSELPSRWREAIDGLDAASIARRPIEQMWSIGEYTDHVRETVFGMRFCVEIALAGEPTTLDEPPEPNFDPTPKPVDLDRALTGFEREIVELCSRLASTAPERWDASLTLGGKDIDIHWMARHALHDVSHHVDDVVQLRVALASPNP